MLESPGKKTRQTVLFTVSAIRGSNVKLVLNPRSVYDNFVNAFYQASDRTITNEQCQQEATNAWKNCKDDKKLVQKFIDTPAQTRMKVLNIPAVKPHKSIGLTVAEESRFDVHERLRELGCTEIESKESRHRLVPPEGMPLNFFKLIHMLKVDPELVLKSGLTKRTDYMNKVELQSKKLVHEDDLITKWKSEYEQRTSLLSDRKKPAKKLKEVEQSFEKVRVECGQTLVQVCQRGHLAVVPGADMSLIVGFVNTSTEFMKQLMLLEASMVHIRERWCIRAGNAVRKDPKSVVPRNLWRCQQQRSWEKTFQFLKIVRYGSDYKKSRLTQALSFSECHDIIKMVIKNGTTHWMDLVVSVVPRLRDIGSSARAALIQWFLKELPIVLVTRGTDLWLIDAHNTLALMMSIISDEQNVQDNEDAENGDDVVINEQVSGDFQDSLDVESETENVEENQPDVEEKHEERSSSTRGPKPIYERFPTLVSTIVAFIQNHGFVAQERRR